MLFKNIKTIEVYLFFALILIASFVFLIPYKRDSKGDDIHFIWMEGERILSGQNPYERILSGNMREDNYYPIYFPLFYLLSALSQKFGLNDFSRWLIFWRPVSILFNIGIGFLFFHVAYQKKNIFIALFSFLFWLFNRWTLDGVLASYLDFMPLFFLTLSLLIFYKHKWTSLFLFSLSLAIKQMGIFLVPLYLIWVWQSSKKHVVKKTFIAGVLIVSVPLIVSLPFIFWNAEGFFKSIIFSATRFAERSVGPPSVDVVIELAGIPARLPMLFFMSLIYLANIKGKINRYISALFVMFTYVYFSPVLFYQHMCWATCFIPLAFYNDKRD